MLRWGFAFACGCSTWLATVALGQAQTVEGDILRGEGAYLRGAGWYNLRTAKAASINVDSTIRWKADLRKIQQERRELEARKTYAKNQNVAEVRLQRARRELELRNSPSANDVQSGEALNALVFDLTDPNLNADRWSAKNIPLPSGTSVKELIFTFTPHRVSTTASAALSRGVIALSRLDIKGKWPTLLSKNELTTEREAYERAYETVKYKVLRRDYAVEEILGLDSALDRLKRKVAAEIPIERGFRAEATKFVEDLRDATRMFDANSVDYAREILIDTQDHDATTVEELVEFMSKYRLQFANSERSPAARVLYGRIYDKLQEQAEALNIKAETAAASSFPDPGDAGTSKGGLPSDPFRVGAVLSGTRKFGSGQTQKWDLRVTRREGDRFAAEITLYTIPAGKRSIMAEGIISSNSVRFKTDRRGEFEQAFDGTVTGKSVDLKFRGIGPPTKKGKRPSGTATLTTRN